MLFNHFIENQYLIIISKILNGKNLVKAQHVAAGQNWVKKKTALFNWKVVETKPCLQTHFLDLDLNGKRPGVSSDGNVSSYLIGRS